MQSENDPFKFDATKVPLSESYPVEVLEQRVEELAYALNSAQHEIEELERQLEATPARGVVTEAMVSRAIRLGRDYGFFDWSESGEARFTAMRNVLTAALTEGTPDAA
jgi:hypothetical protein